MQYIDPYALFELDVQAPEELDRARLKRAKQKVLAEFELSDDIVVTLGGHSLDKATALRLLDELEDPVMRRHHFFLHSQPDLQHFLNENKLRFLRRVPKGEQLGDKDFRKFLSKQLAPVFDRHLSEHLRQEHKPEVSLLIERLDLIDSWDLDSAMKGSIRYLNQNIQSIKAFSEADMAELAVFDDTRLYSMDLMRLMNRLPRVYQHVRNRYGEALKDLALALENRASRTFLAYNMICAASELDTDLSTAEYINYAKVALWRRQREKKASQHTQTDSAWSSSSDDWRNTTTADNPYAQNTEGKGNNNFGCTIGGVIMFVVLMLVISQGKWGSGNNPFSRSYDFNYTPIEMPDFESINRVTDMLDEQESKRERAIFIFDSLEVSDELNWDGYQVEPVELGEEPYKLELSQMFNFGNARAVRINNDSQKDLVFFLVDEEGEKVERHAYVPAGENHLMTLLKVGLKKVALYTGTDWKGGVIGWHGEFLPGFSESVKVFRPGDLKFRNGGTYVRLDKSDSGYMGMNPVEITFDGKRLRKQE